MLSYAKYTDLGNREVNEDAIFCSTKDDKSTPYRQVLAAVRFI